MNVTIPIVLIHRRRAFLSGAARALMAILTAWPANPLPTRALDPPGRGGRPRPLLDGSRPAREG